MATTLEVEIMYSTLNKTTGDFSRKRVGLNAAQTLERDDVLWVIISAETTTTRSRRIIGGVDYERAAQARLLNTDDAALLCRHGGEVALTNARDALYWRWISEDSPLEESPLSGRPVILPRKTIVFNPPTNFNSTMIANALAQAQADLF